MNTFLPCRNLHHQRHHHHHHRHRRRRLPSPLCTAVSIANYCTDTSLQEASLESTPSQRLFPPQHHTMSSLAELRRPVNGDEFLDLDALLRALDDWAVKDKFCFRTQRREATYASWVCAELDCPWKVRARGLSKENIDLIVLAVEDSEHTCVGRGVRKFSSSSKKDWLDPTVSRHLNVTRTTRPQEIVDMLRVQFAEHIDYKRAQECRLRLLAEDIGAQRHSFQLLPAYKLLLEEKSPGVHVDLMRDSHGKFYVVSSPLFSSFVYTN
jgi:hypothetical protein